MKIEERYCLNIKKSLYVNICNVNGKLLDQDVEFKCCNDISP